MVQAEAGLVAGVRADCNGFTLRTGPGESYCAFHRFVLGNHTSSELDGPTTEHLAEHLGQGVLIYLSVCLRRLATFCFHLHSRVRNVEI